MILTDRFVFLHLHKSGGSFVNECLLRFIPGARSVGYHLPRLLVPADKMHLPMLGFVRNPWSYYVSWFNFQSRRPVPNPLFRILSDGGRLGFDATVRNLLDLGSGSPLLDPVIEALPLAYAARGLNLPRFGLIPIRNSGFGFYSYLYKYMFGDLDRNLQVYRAEDLRPKLLEFLHQVGHRVTLAANDFIMDGAPRNTSEHGPYQEYYSDDLRGLVAVRDKLIIARHAYRFA